MSDAPAFVIANFTVHDKDEYRKYEKGFFPILKKHGGEFLPSTTIPPLSRAQTRVRDGW